MNQPTYEELLKEREMLLFSCTIYEKGHEELKQQNAELLDILKTVQAAVNNGVGGQVAGSLLQTRINNAIAKATS